MPHISVLENGEWVKIGGTEHLTDDITNVTFRIATHLLDGGRPSSWTVAEIAEQGESLCTLHPQQAETWKKAGGYMAMGI